MLAVQAWFQGVADCTEVGHSASVTKRLANPREMLNVLSYRLEAALIWFIMFALADSVELKDAI